MLSKIRRMRLREGLSIREVAKRSACRGTPCGSGCAWVRTNFDCVADLSGAPVQGDRTAQKVDRSVFERRMGRLQFERQWNLSARERQTLSGDGTAILRPSEFDDADAFARQCNAIAGHQLAANDERTARCTSRQGERQDRDKCRKADRTLQN
jgi:hypothetical protein